MTTDIFTSTPRPTDIQTATSAATKNGVVTSVWGPDYASMALMLGWTIMQHNDLKSLNAEMVLLTLHWDGKGIGLTAENKTRLQKVGWNIRELDQIQIEGVDFSQIQFHRRHNLNKLQPFGWEEYEKILYIDADTVVKGNFGELFDMPGGTY
jgi:alpha-N-acetylglucosamine transferase